MFCKFCGTQLPVGVGFCPACKKPVIPNAENTSTIASNNDITYMPKVEKSKNIGVVAIGVVLLIIILIIIAKALNII